MQPRFTTIFSIMALLLSVATYGQQVFINEIHYDNSGGDVDEGVEIAGPVGTDLSGWSLVFYNGNGGSTYNTVTLSGVLADQQSGYGTAYFAIPNIQNGSPNGLALIDNSSAVIQFLSYEGAFTAVGGPADGQLSTDIGVAEESGATIGTSMQLTGQGETYTDFIWATGLVATYGAVNEGQTFGEPVTATPLINEFVLNHDGSDVNEFVEVSGDANTDYSSYTLLEIEGDGSGAGTIDEVIAVGSTDANGYWVTAFLSNAFENGTVSLLLVSNFTGSLGDDLDIDNDGTLDATPWDEVVDQVAVYDGGASDLTYGATVLASDYDGGSFPVGGASRIPNSMDTDTASDWVRNDFDGAGLPAFPEAVADAGEAINTPAGENVLATGPVAAVMINELDADTEGTDTAEFIELYDGGIGNVALDGLVLVFYNGNNDQVYRSIDLDGYSTNSEGYFVAGNDGVPNVALIIPSNGIQNGADAVAIYEGDATDFPNGAALTTANIVDAIVYDTDDADDAELLVLLNAGEPQVNENMNGQKDFESLQRIPNGAGGYLNTSSYVADAPTPGTENGAVIEPPAAITIAEARSAAVDEVVTVRGVLTVTDQFAGPAYIQDATAGIAIFDSQIHDNPSLQIGDSIEVTALRDEFNNQIQLGGVSSLTIFGPANQPITPLNITLAELAAHPGELVEVSDIAFPQPGDLLFGNSNYVVTDASGSGELRVDGDVSSLVGLAQPQTCPLATGVVGRFQDIHQLLPRSSEDLPCAEAYEPSGDDLSIPKSATFDIVTWNIEWFGDEGNSPASGSANSDQVQKDSVKAIITELEADIIAVQEITDTTLFAQMVAELPGYDFYLSDYVSRPNDPGAKQHIGFIYNENTVSPDFAQSKVLLASIHPLYNGGDDSALIGYPSTTDRFYASGRMPYMLVADVTISGVTKTLHVVALHARANSGSDAQNRYDMRKYDVEVLKDSLDTYYADVNLILLGDYNDDVDFTVADIPSTVTSYEAYVDDTVNYAIPTAQLSEDGFRSYVFRENMIDHIATSDELKEAFIEGSARVGYQFFDSDYAQTTSDHLPVSARFEFKPPVTFNDSKAVAVVSFNQGKRRNGRPVVWWRSQPEKALDRPLENFYFNFVSLGFGGEIVLELDKDLYNLEGDDFKVFESTAGPLDIPCQFYPETAEVFGSANGVDFTSLGSTCLNGAFDLATAGLTKIKYLKIVDISDPAAFRGNADGYDLDGVWPVNTTTHSGGRGQVPTIADHQNYAPNEEGAFDMAVYPNPFAESVELTLYTEMEETYNLEVYNTLGVLVRMEEIVVGEGTNTIVLDFDNLKAGIYIMRVTDEQNWLIGTERLVKR